MTRLLPLWKLAARSVLALLVAACSSSGANFSGGDDDDDDGTDPASIDLLVIPPLGSDVPAQIRSGLGISQLGDGRYDMSLSSGSPVTIHVRTPESAPVQGAAVRFHMRGAVGYDVVATSNIAGNVLLPLGAGTYDVEIDPDPELDPGLPPRLFRDFVVPGGGATVEQTLTLAPGLRIRGVARSSAGELLQLWQVSARKDGSPDDRSTATTTSMLGAFEVFVPDAGTWNLQLSPPPLALGAPIATIRLEVTAPVEGLQFQFPAIESHTLSGTVSGIGSLASDFGNITVRARASALLVDQPFPGVTISFSGSTATDPSGFFSMPVLHGPYTVTFEPQASFEYSHAVAALEITQDTALADTVTKLYPKVTVAGTALAETTQLGTGGARVRLSSADGQTSYLFSDPDGTSTAGAFEILANVGSYAAEVLPAPDSGLVRKRQSVAVSTAISDLELALTDGLVVHGSVRDPDGDPIELVTIIALDPDTALPVGSDETISDDDGEWTLTVPSLVPGS